MALDQTYGECLRSGVTQVSQNGMGVLFSNLEFLSFFLPFLQPFFFNLQLRMVQGCISTPLLVPNLCSYLNSWRMLYKLRFLCETGEHVYKVERNEDRVYNWFP